MTEWRADLLHPRTWQAADRGALTWFAARIKRICTTLNLKSVLHHVYLKPTWGHLSTHNHDQCFWAQSELLKNEPSLLSASFDAAFRALQHKDAAVLLQCQLKNAAHAASAEASEKVCLYFISFQESLCMRAHQGMGTLPCKILEQSRVTAP